MLATVLGTVVITALTTLLLSALLVLVHFILMTTPRCR